MSKQTEALKLALEYITQSGFQTGINEVITAIREALAEQPAQQEPVAWLDGPHLVMRSDWRDRANYKGPWVDMGRAIPDSWVPALYTSPPASKPDFKAFKEWAEAAGYDTAYTYDTDRSRWLCLNSMTADLWKAWQAAHGIKGDAMLRAREGGAA